MSLETHYMLLKTCLFLWGHLWPQRTLLNFANTNEPIVPKKIVKVWDKYIDKFMEGIIFPVKDIEMADKNISPGS